MTDARGAFHPGDLDELPRDQRTAQHPAERPAIIARRARAERRQQIVAREALAHVEHVRARRAGRQRAFADGVQFITLPEIERQRDDLDRAVRFAKQPIAQPGDRRHLGGAAGKSENDTSHIRYGATRSANSPHPKTPLLIGEGLTFFSFERSAQSPEQAPPSSSPADIEGAGAAPAAKICKPLSPCQGEGFGEREALQFFSGGYPSTPRTD